MTKTLFPGAVHLPWALTLEEQATLAEQCLALGAGTPGRYQPILRSGKPMKLQILCLGRHWNPVTYGYEATRSDHDGLPAPPLPDNLRELAVAIAKRAGTALEPDVCIINYYGTEGRLGLHQDRDERRDTLEAGVPIVSLSLGDDADFQVGGLNRRDRPTTVRLKSGDAFVLGGPSRLRFHGISRVHRGTAPRSCGIQSGRINLTFRQGALCA
ncbi:MAG: alpha-ketoglutarate-dependent dioxygenase AlkB [Acidobacteria bacterium]|nr:alpha-ketoglutarate-dependent dioxygenase AlkB [Acidobacteriota bacterium]